MLVIERSLDPATQIVRAFGEESSGLSSQIGHSVAKLKMGIATAGYWRQVYAFNPFRIGSGEVQRL